MFAPTQAEVESPDSCPQCHTWLVDLALIGNGSFQALIDAKARVRWLCWPRFDSDFVFGHLLDEEHGGSFHIDVANAEVETHQEYVENSAVLRTEFLCRSKGDRDTAFEITDLAPRYLEQENTYRPRQIVRRIVPTKGHTSIRICCSPVSHDGEQQLQATAVAGGLSWQGHEQGIELAASGQIVAIQGEQFFTLAEPLYVVLTWGSAPASVASVDAAERSIAKTISHWQEWIREASLPTEFRDAVVRSMITLKLHQFEDTGAVTAATTTSVPEHPGSGRNWDYRFCWPRDSYFTVEALARLGHRDAARDFVEFVGGLERLQPLYGIGGEVELEERCLPKLSGYQGEQPVRVGNQAYVQDQHDIYGELLAAAELVVGTSGESGPSLVVRDLSYALLDAIESNLRAPDAGLWEKRQEPALHTFSLLMHWHGCNAAMKIAGCFSDEQLAERALRLREAARSILEEECWRAEEGFFADSTLGHYADASLFMMVTTGFLAPDDSRARSHVEHLACALSVRGHLLFRYRHDDGLGATHATFTVCGFWYAEALACLGDHQTSREVVTAILEHANHVGLLSEDIDPESGALWGNFPQTYSHVGIINCALALTSTSA